MSFKLKVRAPKYYSQFKCLAGDCRNTCCNMEWDILVSRNEYSKLKNADFSPETRVILDDILKRRKVHSSDSDYAAITTGSYGGRECPLLDENRLCRLQLECGYSILTKVCKFYPRNFYAYGDGASAVSAISSSCEAMAKILMNDPNALEIGDTEMEFTSHSDIPLNTGISPNTIKKHEIANYFRPIHDVGMNILGAKEFELSDRMILLGYAYQKLDEIAKNEQYDDIATFVNKIRNPAYQRAILEALGSIEHSYERGVICGVKALLSVAERAKAIGRINNTFVGSMEVVLKRYITDEFAVEEVDMVKKFSIVYDVERYRQDVEIFERYLAERPHMLSNLFMNIFIEKGMPFFSLDEGIWGNYMAFCYWCFVLKFTVVSALGAAIDAGADTKEKQDVAVEDAVIIFSQSFLHVGKGVTSICSDLNSTDTNTLAHMAVLIKS